MRNFIALALFAGLGLFAGCDSHNPIALVLPGIGVNPSQETKEQILAKLPVEMQINVPDEKAFKAKYGFDLAVLREGFHKGYRKQLAILPTNARNHKQWVAAYEEWCFNKFIEGFNDISPSELRNLPQSKLESRLVAAVAPTESEVQVWRKLLGPS